MSHKLIINLGPTDEETYIKINDELVRTKEIEIKVAVGKPIEVKLLIYPFFSDIGILDIQGYLLSNEEYQQYQDLLNKNIPEFPAKDETRKFTDLGEWIP